jgi:hypothetical protein
MTVTLDTHEFDAMVNRIIDNATGLDVIVGEVADHGATQASNVPAGLDNTLFATPGRSPSRYSRLIVSDDPAAPFAFQAAPPTFPDGSLTDELAQAVLDHLFNV